MKIIFLNKYQNKVNRGAETFISELSKRLSKNHEVEVVADINYFDLLKKKFDVIIPTNGRCQVVLVRLISWLKGAKMLVSGQSGIGWDDRVNLYSFPNFFVALSSKALAWAKSANPFIRSVYIPNGVDLTRFNAKKSKGRTVLAVGAFTKQKRLDLAINAVAKLDGVKLIIAGGGGELKEKIHNLGIDKLGKEMFELISVPFRQMPEVYSKADVFTLPSEPSEAFGNVLVEAMASGLPVVASDDPIRREIVVDPKNTDAYASAIKKALETDWGDKPRLQAEKFSWDDIADKYESLFKRLSGNI